MDENLNSKVVSFRLPMGAYVQLLQHSLDTKMGVSDYVLTKLYAEDKITQLTDQLHQQSSELTQVKKLLADSKAVVTRKEKEASDLTGSLSATSQKTTQERQQLQKQVDALTQEVKTLREAEKAATSGRSNWENEAARLTKEVKTLTAQNAELVSQVKGMKTRAGAMYKELESVHNRAFMGAVDKDAWAVLEGLKKL